jgi:hypothetical protein
MAIGSSFFVSLPPVEFATLTSTSASLISAFDATSRSDTLTWVVARRGNASVHLAFGVRLRMRGANRFGSNDAQVDRRSRDDLVPGI